MAESRQGGVPWPAIRPHDGPRNYGGLDEAGQRGARGVRDDLEPNPSRRTASDLDGGHDPRLVEELAAAAHPRLGAPDVVLVHFDLGWPRVPVGAAQGAAQLLEQGPSCFVPREPSGHCSWRPAMPGVCVATK